MKPKRGVQRIESDEVFVEPFTDEQSHDAEFSLEELSEAYSKLIGEPEAAEIADASITDEAAETALEGEVGSLNNDSKLKSSDTGVLTGRSIIEAVLFVGNPENIGLKPDSVAAAMRGVQASEVVEWIAELNQQYTDQGHVMRIVEDESGFRMQLAPEYQSVRDSMTGKLRETQLNQAAIDCLSLVAYRPGISRDEVERLWSRPASSVLSLLVRRELLRIEREGTGKKAVIKYFPTDRFLNLIGIASLDDLPTSESEFE